MSQSSPETEKLFEIFEAAYWAEWKVHHGTEPTQARRAGMDAVIAHLRTGVAPRQQQPVAWVVFAENGNVRLWGPDQAGPQAFADARGLVCEPVYRAQAALVAQGIEQGSSKPEVAGSNPAERATPLAWICTSSSEAFVTQDQDEVRAFMDRDNGWTVTPLYTRSSATLALADTSTDRTSEACTTCGGEGSITEFSNIVGETCPDCNGGK